MYTTYMRVVRNIMLNLSKPSVNQTGNEAANFRTDALNTDTQYNPVF